MTTVISPATASPLAKEIETTVLKYAARSDHSKLIKALKRLAKHHSQPTEADQAFLLAAIPAEFIGSRDAKEIRTLLHH